MGRWIPLAIALPITVVVGVLTPLNAQWFMYPSTRAPRTPGGSVDLSAAAPRLTNGQPDLSGVWMTAEPACVIRGTAPLSDLRKLIPPSLKCPVRQASFSRQSINIGIDMPDGLPYQPCSQPWSNSVRRTRQSMILTSAVNPISFYARTGCRTT